MKHRWLMSFLGIAACGDRPPATLPPPQVFDRTQVGVVPPDCNLGSTCPDAVAGLDPALCISDASPFIVQIDDTTGGIVDVKFDPTLVGALALAPGRWWSAFADPNGSCDFAVTLTVPVEEPDAP